MQKPRQGMGTFENRRHYGSAPKVAIATMTPGGGKPKARGRKGNKKTAIKNRVATQTLLQKLVKVGTTEPRKISVSPKEGHGKHGRKKKMGAA